MKLNNLLNNIDFEVIRGDLEKNIVEISYDSREIEENNLFIAIKGFETDGHQYIAQAVENGASAVIIENEISEYQPETSYIKVKNSRRVMAEIAKNFFNNPLSDINLVGITGTNGKTTTAYLLYNILKEYAGRAALFGTIKNIIGGNEVDSSRTTPESLDLYRYFARMKARGIKYGVMEVSSHALDLYRVYGMDFAAAIFTNISPEHLNYHKNFENYKAVKSRLFSNLNSRQYAVINADDPNAEYIKEKSNGQNFSYSLNSKTADLYTSEYQLNQKGMKYKSQGRVNLTFELNLGGIFNIYNSLAAILTADLLGIEKEVSLKALTEIKSVPGRFEIINAGQDFQIVVDYAHTPDGMKNVLETAAAVEKNRLIVLFGCGGDRDRSKRPEMARLAEKYADYTIVSNDNPRSEDPAVIFSEIKKGFSESFSDYQIIPDRKKAIEAAVKMAEKGDLLMLLGRGHEKYQIIKDKKIELDDRRVAYQAVEKMKGY
ncbi:MAG: UDP-N-acetylmuramoyl-L-alanyl-D-glutamate--2,6-diaminopimelate ligase [bacterium]